VKEHADSKSPKNNVHQYIPRKRSPAHSEEEPLMHPAVAPGANAAPTDDDDDPGPSAA
jgi:hypothetical protein